MEDQNIIQQSEKSHQQRLQNMDVLRGLALLGIFIANIYYFSGIGFMNSEQKAAFTTATADHWVHFFSTFLIEGKFYSIFSLLFGAGFALLLVRAQQKGIDFKKYYSKRLLILLVIGLIHLFVIWPGDILTLYAVLGFLLIFFVNTSIKRLWQWAIALLLLPIPIYCITYFTGGLNFGIPFFIVMELVASKLFTSPPGIYEILAAGTVAEVFKFNLVGGLDRLGDLLYSNRLPRVFGMFLIGFIFIRKGIFHNTAENKNFLKKAFFSGIALGIPGSLAMAVFAERGNIYNLTDPTGIWLTIAYAIGVHALAIGYTAAILLLLLKAKTARILQFFAPAGKMAFTNYLMQTAIGISVFYGIGLGYAGVAGYTIIVLIAIIIFAIQVFYSRIWLSYFHYGPVEWLWRSLLLGKSQKFRIERRAVPAQPVM